MLVSVSMYAGGQIKGVLNNQYLDEPYEFSSFMQMIDKMESVFDSKKFPQAFLSPRKFENVAQGTKKRKAEGIDEVMQTATKVNLEPNEQVVTSKCTFEITVKSRQNATWQGHILWAEKNTRQSFRSVLEMLKLMDDALKGDAAPSGE